LQIGDIFSRRTRYKCLMRKIRKVGRWGTIFWAVSLFAFVPVALPQEPDTSPSTGTSEEKAFSDALYAEEVKGDAEAALEAYADLAKRFERQRNLAAAALYRQGECLRKLNRPEDAAACYAKVISLYPDQDRLGKLSRENLIALGKAPAEPGAVVSEAQDEEAKEIARLEEMIRNSPDLLNAATGTNSRPPLHVAASAGQLRVVEFLLKSGADKKGALGFAAAAGHKAVCEALLDAGADINDDGTPLISALESGRESVAAMLLERGADPNLGAWTIPLSGVNTVEVRVHGLGMAIAKTVSKPLLEQIIRAKANPNKEMLLSTRDRKSESPKPGGEITPLHLAIRCDNVDAVDQLIAAGADLNELSGPFRSDPPPPSRVVAREVHEGRRTGQYHC